MSIFSHQYRSSGNRGFTLIELLVVMALMVIITGVLLFKQSKFDSSTLLRSLAYSVALSVRQAQVYGTSVLGTASTQANCGGGFYNSSLGSCYASAYGLYFNTAAPGIYTLFADLNNNGRYDVGIDAIIKNFSINTGYTVSTFCVKGTHLGSPVTQCSPATISSLAVVFRRPNPDATFTALDVNGNAIAGDIYSSANIQLQNINDTATLRSVTVTNTGLISAQ